MSSVLHSPRSSPSLNLFHPLLHAGLSRRTNIAPLIDPSPRVLQRRFSLVSMDNEEFHTELRSGSNKNAHGIRKAISQRSGSRAPLHESDCGTRRGQEKHSRWIGVRRTQGHYRPVACDEGPIAVRPAIRFGARLDDRVTDEINEANVKLSRVDENERDYDYLGPVSAA